MRAASWRLEQVAGDESSKLEIRAAKSEIEAAAVGREIRASWDRDQSSEEEIDTAR